jgi:ArsR family transcriptional regulator, arsenate/arsenite/antimonite-responsive transcriptional repressor
MDQNEKKLEQLVDIAKALSDSHRVRALMALRAGELCVCQLIDLLKLAPSTVSKHMSVLKQSGLVESRKDSRWVYYRLPEQGEEILVDRIIDLMCSAVENDKHILIDKNEVLQVQKNGINSICNVKSGELINGGCCE